MGGLAALVIGAVCIGFAPLWVRWSETGPVATAFHRLLLALPAIVVWAVRDRRGVTEEGRWTRSDLYWAAVAGLFFGIDLGTWHLSIRFTTVANATLLANFAPVFVTLGAWIFLREHVGSRFFVGMGLSLLGAGLLTGASFQADSIRLKGDVLGLVTAAFYGGYQLCVARLRRRHASGQVLFWASVTCIPVLWLYSYLLGERILPVSARGWLILVGLALTAQVMGQGLITYGFAHLPAGYSSLTLLVQPFVATLAAWIWLGESMRISQILGGVILLSGLFLARRATELRSTEPGNSAGACPPRR